MGKAASQTGALPLHNLLLHVVLWADGEVGGCAPLFQTAWSLLCKACVKHGLTTQCSALQGADGHVSLQVIFQMS